MASVGLLTAVALGGIGTAVAAKQVGDKVEKFTRPRSFESVPQPQAITPPPALAAPTIEDAAPAAEVERKKNRRQRGRASTVFAGALGDDSLQGGTAKTTLGA